MQNCINKDIARYADGGCVGYKRVYTIVHCARSPLTGRQGELMHIAHNNRSNLINLKLLLARQ